MAHHLVLVAARRVVLRPQLVAVPVAVSVAVPVAVPVPVVSERRY